MARPVNPNKTYRGFSRGQRRLWRYKLTQLACQNGNGLVYDYQLPAWMIGRLLHGGYIKRLEKGVLLVVKHE